MNREFRIATLHHLMKKAGVISDLVEKSLTKDTSKEHYQVLGSVGTGTSIMMPENPIKTDNSVDVLFQIRGISKGDTKTASNMGKNAVIVTCEAGGVSKENLKAFGDPSFINQAINKVLNHLKQLFPNKEPKLGKLTISSFSGGGSAVANLLTQRARLPKGTQPPKFIFIDGLHTDPSSSTMKAIVDYAREVKDNPAAGELSIIHTAVVPIGYASTTETANHILGQVGLQRIRNNDQNGAVSSAQLGGLKVVQLYDKQDPYMVKDPKTGKIKPNVPGTAGWQHMQALNWSLRNEI